MFLAARARPGVALSLAAIAGAATIPVHAILAPPASALSLRRFPDGAVVRIEGRLIREAERYHGRVHLFVEAERASQAPELLRPARGTVRVTVLKPVDFRIGETVRISARIRFPRNFGNPGEFDYEAYQARQGIAATMVVPRIRAGPAPSVEVVDYRPEFPATAIEAIRRRIGAFIDAHLEYPEREEMRALIIGDRGGINDQLRNRFALTGMAHLLVISGLHLGFVAAAVFAIARLLLGFFPTLLIRGWANKIAAIAGAIAVTAYAAIAGHHVSTLRALIMVLSYVTAIVIDRSREVLASLALAALVICFVFPGSSADIGFQLSFCSVLVIIVGMRRFADWWKRRSELFVRVNAPGVWRYRIAEAILGYLAVPFWAMVGTAPLTAYHFNQFAIVGLVANAVVVPIMGAAGVVVGLISIAISFASNSVGAVGLMIAGQFLRAGTWLAGWFMTWPCAWVRTFTPTLPELAIAYGFLSIWLLWPIEQTDRLSDQRSPEPRAPAFRWRAVCLLLLLAASIADAAFWVHERFFRNDLQVTFLSVGQGDAAVVRFPGSRVMLIDAGGGPGEFDPGERIVAPYLWSRKIMHVDYIVLSHPELDHFGGFDFIARNFSPSQFWTTTAASPDLRYERLLTTLASIRTRLFMLDSTSAPLKIGGVAVRCLGPAPGQRETRNNGSMLLRLAYGRYSILFTGDLEARGERELIARISDLRSTVLKVPHHGSATSSTEAFAQAVEPSVAVVSLGYHNRFGFPAGDVVDRYESIGARVLRTDQVGAVGIDATAKSIEIWAGPRRTRVSATWQRPG
jgi:competence protein ComEC